MYGSRTIATRRYDVNRAAMTPFGLLLAKQIPSSAYEFFMRLPRTGKQLLRKYVFCVLVEPGHTILACGRPYGCRDTVYKFLSAMCTEHHNQRFTEKLQSTHLFDKFIKPFRFRSVTT